MRCLEAARLAAKPEDLRSISTGGKNFPSAIDVLRGVASTRMCRSCATKSEDVSLQTNHLHSSAINSGVLKIRTHLAWENIPNANICVGVPASTSSFLHSLCPPGGIHICVQYGCYLFTPTDPPLGVTGAC